MKKILALVLLAAGLVVPAQAAIVGFEAGYLTDWKESYFSGRLGYELKADASLSHQLEVELGYTEKSESVAVTGGVVTAKGKIVPLMVNYRGEIPGANKLGGYFGVGLGTARVSASGSGFGVSISDGDNAMAYQAFGGVNYKPNDATLLNLGIRYIWIDDVTIMGTNADIGSDFGLSAGISFKF